MEHLIVDAGSLLFRMKCRGPQSGIHPVRPLINRKKVELREAQDAFVEATFGALSCLPAGTVGALQVEIVFRKPGNRPSGKPVRRRTYPDVRRRTYPDDGTYTGNIYLTFVPDAVEFFLQSFWNRAYAPEDEIFIVTMDGELAEKLLEVIGALRGSQRGSQAPVICVMQPREDSYLRASPVPFLIDIEAARKRGRLLYV